MRHMVRHPTGVSKAWSLLRPAHAQRCDVALLATAVSGVPIQPFSARVSCPTIGTTLLIRTNSSVLISVLRFLRANDFEKVGVERD